MEGEGEGWGGGKGLKSCESGMFVYNMYITSTISSLSKLCTIPARTSKLKFQKKKKREKKEENKQKNKIKMGGKREGKICWDSSGGFFFFFLLRHAADLEH